MPEKLAEVKQKIAELKNEDRDIEEHLNRNYYKVGIKPPREEDEEEEGEKMEGADCNNTKN